MVTPFVVNELQYRAAFNSTDRAKPFAFKKQMDGKYDRGLHP
jgi:hypothetical protein